MFEFIVVSKNRIEGTWYGLHNTSASVDGSVFTYTSQVPYPNLTDVLETVKQIVELARVQEVDVTDIQIRKTS